MKLGEQYWTKGEGVIEVTFKLIQSACGRAAFGRCDAGKVRFAR